MTATRPVLEESLVFDNGRPATWAETSGRLERASTFWLATRRPSGPPHVVPILAVSVDGVLYFAAGAGTAKARHLASEPHCTLATSNEGFDLVVEGTASRVREETRLRRVADAYDGKYGWRVKVRDGAFHDTPGAPTAGLPPYDVFEVAPTAAFAFGTEEDTQYQSARWRF